VERRVVVSEKYLRMFSVAKKAIKLPFGREQSGTKLFFKIPLGLATSQDLIDYTGHTTPAIPATRLRTGPFIVLERWCCPKAERCK
jgi:hypothetical protein